MPIGFLQLNYKGEQDIILSSKPEYNFFKCVFKRYVNFSIEPIKQTINGSCNFGNHVSCKIQKAGDLLSNLFLIIKLPSLTINSGSYAGWTNSIGFILIDNVEFYIGGNLICRRTGEFMAIEDEFITTESKRISKNLMIGRFEDVSSLETNASNETIYTIPLGFWFCKYLPLALPLLNLQYHPVDIRIQFKPFNDCIVFDGLTGPSQVDFTSCELWADYVFFDDSIRKKLVSHNVNYLIEQVQRTPSTSISSSVSSFRTELQFNHPVKYLFWFYRELDSETNNDWLNFSARSDGGKIATSSVIQVDSNELFAERDESYFRLVQPNLHFSRSPLKYIYSYSFAKCPEDYQPSGTFNFSKVDSAVLASQIRSSVATASNCIVYAVNYNVLVFRYGMAALLWSS